MSASDLKQGSKIAQIAFVVMLALGMTELIVGSLARTVSLLADGIHSISTGVIFFIVWIGLRLSGRSPDGTFHFGYYRVEALGSLIAAFALTGFGGFVLFEAYNVWIEESYCSSRNRHSSSYNSNSDNRSCFLADRKSVKRIRFNIIRCRRVNRNYRCSFLCGCCS